jgi:STE24 endopeptidase
MGLKVKYLYAIGLLGLFFPVFAGAAPFDPAVATRAYLDTLQGAERAKSDAYFEGGYWLLLWSALVGVLSQWAILHFGLSARFRDWAERVTKRRALATSLYALPYILAVALITLPWTVYTDFVREKQYDLMNQSFGEWLIDFGKAMGVNIIVTGLMLMAIFAIIRRAPHSWWLWGAGAMSAFFAIGAMVVPVFLAPLFNTYTELKPGPIRDRIVAMAAANHVPADHIYVFDASKQTKRVSANVSGLGPTIRISLNDNLLNRTSPPEIAAVMGHELGHYVLNHIWKSIGAFTVVFLLVFWLLSRIVPAMIAQSGTKWGVRDVTDVAAVPVFSIAVSVLFLLLTPVTNTLIRVHETEADAFGLDASREPDGEALVDLRLAEYRKMEPGPIEEFIFFDHPSGANRIRMAMDWKARELAKGDIKP